MTRIDAGGTSRYGHSRTRRCVTLALIGSLLLFACSDDEPDPASEPAVTANNPAPSAQSRQSAQADTPTGLFAKIPEVVRAVSPSVVAVITDTGEGSGVIWQSDGTIVTNNHVVQDRTRVAVAFADGKRANATVVARDPSTDLAVLRADRKDLPAARFADRVPVVGELVIALGNPLGFENSATAGIISGVSRGIAGAGRQSPALVDLLQTDAPISPGNSGGALVDATGAVVGVNVAYIPPQASAVSIGFAIPAPTVVDVVSQLLATGSVRHPFLGVQVAALTAEIAQQLSVEVDAGIVVFSVVERSPAAAAGLQAGDIIVRFDGDEIRTVADFLGRLRKHKPGEQVDVTVVRGDSRRDVTITLTEHPT